MNSFRILIIVLASDTDPIYCKFQAAWKLAQHPRADIFFLKAHPDIQGEDFICGDTIYIKCRETLDAVYEKQMRCFKLILPMLKNYTFVFRTNLSSYLDIPVYLDFCATLPHTNLYSGVIGRHEEVPFASGSGLTISPDLIRRLVEENPPEVLVDDVSIGSAIMKWGIKILPAPREDYLQYGHYKLTSSQWEHNFHIRIKTDNRENDVQLLKSLFMRE